MNMLLHVLRRKLVLAVLAAAVVGGGAYAFAATLNVGGSTLQAGNAAVSGCQGAANAITPSYTTVFQGGHYDVGVVTIKNIDAACATAGAKLKIALSDGSNALLSELQSATVVTANTGSSPTTDLTVDFTAENVPASDVDNISIAVA